jgi:hypothetical protein
MLWTYRRVGEKSWVKKIDADTPEQAAELAAAAYDKSTTEKEADQSYDIEVCRFGEPEGSRKSFTVSCELSAKYVARTLHSDPLPGSKVKKENAPSITVSEVTVEEEPDLDQLEPMAVSEEKTEPETEAKIQPQEKGKSSRKAEKSKSSSHDFDPEK